MDLNKKSDMFWFIALTIFADAQIDQSANIDQASIVHSTPTQPSQTHGKHQIIVPVLSEGVMERDQEAGGGAGPSSNWGIGETGLWHSAASLTSMNWFLPGVGTVHGLLNAIHPTFDSLIL